jgi:uncharacterized membrane protein YtjA (UPF0391 family)
MSGWVPPAPPGGEGPVVGWVMPTEPAGLSVGECTRAGWRITRSALGPLAVITAIPMVLLNLLYIPFWISISTMLEGWLRFWAELDWSRYRYDPEGLQRDMQAAMQPTTELSVVASAATGLAVVVGIIAVGALTAATLDAAAGRPVSIGRAYRVAFGRLAVVVPALVLGVGYVAVFVPLSLAQPEMIYGGGMAGAPGLAALFGIVALVLEILAIYLAVRWALYFQVVAEERLGVRGGLARASALSAGVRVRIAVVLLVVSLVIGLAVSFAVAIPVLFVGLLAGSALAGLLTATVAFSVVALVYLPFIVAVVTYVYRRRIEELPAT